MNDEERINSAEERLSRLEAVVENLANQLGTIESALQTGFREVHAAINEMRRPQWSTIGQFLALAITIGALVIGPIWVTVGIVYTDQREIQKNQFTQDDFLHWDTVMQREMRLLDQSLERRLEAVDQRQEQLRKEVDWQWNIWHDVSGARARLKRDE